MFLEVASPCKDARSDLCVTWYLREEREFVRCVYVVCESKLSVVMGGHAVIKMMGGRSEVMMLMYEFQTFMLGLCVLMSGMCI